MKFLKISWKNVVRNRKRSLMTVGILVFGVMMFVFYSSFIDGFIQYSVNGTIKEELGHIRVRVENYDETYPYDKKNLWFNSTNYFAQISNIVATPRLELQAEIDNYNDTLYINLIGIDPRWDNLVYETSLKNSSSNLTKNMIWLGETLAKDLEINQGDYINVSFQNINNSYVSKEFLVADIIQSINPIISANVAIINLDILQQLYNTNAISHYGVVLSQTNQLTSIAKQIKSLYPNKAVMTWIDMTEELQQTIVSKKDMLNIFYIMIAIIALLGLINSILISVWEKRKITGMLRSLGYLNHEILRIFVYEGFWIGLLGATLGVGLGALINLPFTLIGINFAAFLKSSDGSLIDMGFYIPQYIYSVWKYQYFLYPIIVVPIVAALISYLPARKSITISIAECLKNKD